MGFTPPYLEVRKVSGGWSASAPTATVTDDLVIYANTGINYPSITLNGSSYIKITVPTGENVRFAEQTTGDYFKISYATPDVALTGMIADKNISIVPTGTGLLKYGTYVAGAKADSIGYIEILDSGGTSRRLMVQSA